MKVLGLALFAAGGLWAIYWGWKHESAKRRGADLDVRWALLNRGWPGVPIAAVGLVLAVAGS